MPRVALIHALVESVAPINEVMARDWPEADRLNLLDDSLSADLARSPTGLDAAMTGRFVALTDYAVRAGAAGVLFTCSAFGPCIEEAARRFPAVPVLKPNEAMIAEAAAVGGRVGLVATFGPTLASMVPEFPPAVALRTALAAGGLEALRAGHADRHDDRVVAAARRLVSEEGCAVVALAQFSMARAAPRVAAAVGVPVLTTPGTAVRALRARVERAPFVE
ncbi:MAG: arylsulfatase [Gemmatimonadetes bacterium]|nr:arylsulfatase [Gemmatimonadota bacterium]